MISKGVKVQWRWGRGTAYGVVKDVFDRPLTITSKGIKVTRNGSAKNRALFIQQENGTELLKLENEVKMIK